MRFVIDSSAHMYERPGELLPCPFCGSEAAMHQTWSSTARYYVSCCDDKMLKNPRKRPCRIQQSSYSYKTMDEAAEMWNYRYTEDKE